MSAPRPRLVLVGAGHAHALVLRRWIRRPVDADVTLVTDQPFSTYSGMVPGVLAGDYDGSETRIDAAALARRAGARFVLARARLIDPARRRLELDDGSSLPWDIASLDVGSSLRGIDWPGVRKHTLPVRPIGEFADRIDAALARCSTASPRIAIVGGGPAGVEVAFTLQARLRARNRSGTVHLVCRRGGLLPRYPERARRLVMAEAAARGLEIAMLPEVRFADSEGIGFESGHLDADVVLWATGAAAPEFIRNSPLLHDRRGFVRAKTTLEVVGEEGLFAAGDCASIEGWPNLGRTGVHAVRQAPVLEANLRRALAGQTPKAWHPQSQSLSVLNLGQRRAMAVRWEFAVTGHLAWKLKDWIDRRFVDSFRAPARPEPAGGTQVQA